MITASRSAPRRHLNDPEVLGQIHRLSQADNHTNWFYLAREYLCLAVVCGGVIVLCQTFWDGLWSLAWAVPVFIVAILVVGALQHRLATLTHEAVHGMLFRNSLVNELVSEWFCMFPMFGTTHRYRIQHLGHHQHPNHPELDPDLVQLALSGHHFEFPLTLREFLWQCFAKQWLWLPALVRYVLVRASFQANHKAGPFYVDRKVPIYVTLSVVTYYALLLGAVVFGVCNDATVMLFWVPALLLAGGLLIIRCGPAAWFPEYPLKCEISQRFRSALRLTFNSLVIFTLASLTYWTGEPWWLFYFLLWVVPLGTSFAFFMMLGQVAQHGNASQDRFSTTRIFLVHPLIRMAVFPIGNEYHLPHHLFMKVPHYRLPQLHEMLMQTAPYHDEAVIVGGYFFRDPVRPDDPTVLDLMTGSEAAGPIDSLPGR